MSASTSRCIIIGASHAGVSTAFNLRQSGWLGEILLLEASNQWPHQKPPLSKAFLLGKTPLEKLAFKQERAFKDHFIEVRLSAHVERIDRENNEVWLDGKAIGYDKLVLATGASPIVPTINGIDTAPNVFTLRDLADAKKLKATISVYEQTVPRVVIIGAGYIGLEVAATVRTLGAKVTVLEREGRVLSRVTSSAMSEFVESYHKDKGVVICTGKQVTSIEHQGEKQVVRCADDSVVAADIVLIGVGVKPNQSLAEDCGLVCNNGIEIDRQCQTSDKNILAVGDCARFFHPTYDMSIRLESVQNAADMAKVAAQTLVGNASEYSKIPWFWSDQYEMKIQIVGLADQCPEIVVRQERHNKNCLSMWYFRGDELRCVEAINNPKAYMLGMKAMQTQGRLNKNMLKNTECPLSADILVV